MSQMRSTSARAPYAFPQSIGTPRGSELFRPLLGGNRLR